MNKAHSHPSPSQREITVPRDRDLDTAEKSRRNRMPSTDEVNARDEDFATTDQPLRPGSQAERDSGRPGREGVTGKSLPPRGRL